MKKLKPLTQQQEIIQKHLVNPFTTMPKDWHKSMGKMMDEWAKLQSISFQEYHERFRREEGRFFKKECERLGGMFSLADYGVENIYNDFVAKKPIKSAMLPVESFWQYDDKGELVHVITNEENKIK